MRKPVLRFLSEGDLQSIYQASLRVLDEVGILLEHAEAQDMLEGAGARIDREANRAYLPPDLVDRCRRQIPKQLTYHGRTPEFDRVVSLDGPLCGRHTGGCPGYIDPYTGEYRLARIEDWKAFVTVSDYLPKIGMVANQHCHDAPGRTNDLHSLRVVLENQRKCSVHGANTIATLRYQLEMLLAVYGTREALAARPMIHHMVPPINPLFFDEDHTAQILLAVDYGLPMDMPVMSIVGITSPATAAGTLVQNLAEELAATTLVQTRRPGHPQAFFIDPCVGNMRSGAALVGAPESALILAAICQLGAELFGLPTEAIGLLSDGFSGAQTQAHKMQNLIFQVLAGGKLVAGTGVTESIMALSPVQLVIDDEYLAIAERWLRGIATDPPNLAVDVIARVGPRGDYLSDEHTLDAIRAGLLLDLPLAERDGRRAMWELGGEKTLESKAAAKARQILETHEVPPLPDEVQRELAAILGKADGALAG